MYQLRLCERKGPGGIDEQVVVGGRNEHQSSGEAVAAFGHLDRQLGTPVQHLGQQALVAGIEMLDQEHRDRKRRWQSRQERGEGRQPAG